MKKTCRTCEREAEDFELDVFGDCECVYEEAEESLCGCISRVRKDKNGMFMERICEKDKME